MLYRRETRVVWRPVHDVGFDLMTKTYVELCYMYPGVILLECDVEPVYKWDKQRS